MICLIDHPIMRDAIALVLRRLQPDTTIVELARLSEIEPNLNFNDPPCAIFLDLHSPDAQPCARLAIA